MRKLWRDLTQNSRTDRYSHAKIGMIIAGASMTYMMLVKLPMDAMLWLVYLGCVGGYSAATRFLDTQK